MEGKPEIKFEVKMKDGLLQLKDVPTNDMRSGKNIRTTAQVQHELMTR